MEPIKIESKQTLSREPAAFLRELGNQLAEGDHVDLDRQGVHYSFGVPVDLEVELELDDNGTELEIELHW